MVLLTNDAVRDLEELYDYIARHDTPEKADDVLTRIEEAFSGRLEIPDRWTYPREKAIP